MELSVERKAEAGAAGVNRAMHADDEVAAYKSLPVDAARLPIEAREL